MLQGSKAGIGWLLLACAMGWIAACSHEAPSPAGPVVLHEEPPAEALARARATARDLGQSLTARLFRELEGGDPLQAIEVCEVAAQEIAAAHSKDGIHVRRISRRFRNPADEPDAYEYAKLDELEALKDQGNLPSESAEVVLEDGTKRLRYLKPILLKQPCLMCHGSVADIDDRVLDAIHRQYPGDQAIDFKVGDLRGAISVSVDL